MIMEEIENCEEAKKLIVKLVDDLNDAGLNLAEQAKLLRRFSTVYRIAADSIIEMIEQKQKELCKENPTFH